MTKHLGKSLKTIQRMDITPELILNLLAHLAGATQIGTQLKPAACRFDGAIMKSADDATAQHADARTMVVPMKRFEQTLLGRPTLDAQDSCLRHRY